MGECLVQGTAGTGALNNDGRVTKGKSNEPADSWGGKLATTPQWS